MLSLPLVYKKSSSSVGTARTSEGLPVQSAQHLQAYINIEYAQRRFGDVLDAII